MKQNVDRGKIDRQVIDQIFFLDRLFSQFIEQIIGQKKYDKLLLVVRGEERRGGRGQNRV